MRSARAVSTRLRVLPALVAVSALFRATWALEPVPEARRIPATMVRSIAAPDDTPMHMPTDVAVDGTGTVFVADGANDRVVRFRSDGLFESGIVEAAGRRLRKPVGLTVDASGWLWIADTGNHRVVVLAGPSDPGEALEPPAPPEGGRAFDPTDVLVTPDGRRTYVVDNDHHRIAIRNNGSGDWTILGNGPGRALGQFEWPFALAIDREGYVYITEAIGGRVQRLSPADQWAGQVPAAGAFGTALGQLYRPKGIAVDARGRLFVNDSTTGAIQVFESRGELVGALTDAQGFPLKFRHPMGMAFDREGRLYVVELLANRIAVVSLSGAAAAPASRPAGGGG